MLCMQRHSNSILYVTYALSFVLMVFSFVIFFYYYYIDMHLRESSSEKYLQHDSYVWEYTCELFMFYADANAMVLFRMFGLHLVTIIVHALIHTAVLIVIILQITYLHFHNEDGGYRSVEKTFYKEYPYACYMFIAAYLLQMLLSLHLIVFRPGHTFAQREWRSGMHAFFGLITFVIMFWNILVHVTMLCIANPHALSTSKDIPQDNLLWEPQVIGLFLMLYLLLILFILLTPYFRYDSKTCYDSDECECCMLEKASSITIEVNYKLAEDDSRYCGCKPAMATEADIRKKPCPQTATSCPLRKRHTESSCDLTQFAAENKCSKCASTKQKEQGESCSSAQHTKSCKTDTASASCPLRAHNTASSCSLTQPTKHVATTTGDMKQCMASITHEETLSCPTCASPRGSTKKNAKCSAKKQHADSHSCKATTAPKSPTSCPLKVHNTESSCSLPLKREHLATQLPDMKRSMTSLSHEESFSCPSCSTQRASANKSSKCFPPPKQKAELDSYRCEPSEAKRTKRSPKKTCSAHSLQEKPKHRNLHVGSKSTPLRKEETAKQRIKPISSSLADVIEVRRRIYIPPAKAPKECHSTTTLPTKEDDERRSCLKVSQPSQAELNVSVSQGSTSPDSVQEDDSRHRTKPSCSKKPKRKLSAYDCQQIKGHCSLARVTDAPEICYERGSKRSHSLPRNAGGSNRKWSESVPRRASSLPRAAIFEESAASAHSMSLLSAVGSYSSVSQHDIKENKDVASNLSWHKKGSSKYKTKKL